MWNTSGGCGKLLGGGVNGVSPVKPVGMTQVAGGVRQRAGARRWTHVLSNKRITSSFIAANL
jgi:hypothetical protein